MYRHRLLVITILTILLLPSLSFATHPVVESCRNAAFEYSLLEDLDEPALAEKLQQEPENAFVYFRLAALKDARNDTARTEFYFQRARTLAGDDIGKHWVIAQGFLDLGYWRYADAEQTLDKIYDLKLDLGGEVLPLIPHALLSRAYTMLRSAKSSADFYHVQTLFETAIRLDPTLLSPRFSLLWVAFKRLDFHGVSKEAKHLYTIFQNSIYHQFLLWLNLYHLVFAILYLTLITFVFFLLGKYYPKTFHRILEILPKGMPTPVKFGVGSAITGLPLILFIGLDIIWLALLAIVAVWIYLKPFERNSAILLVVFGLCTPFISQYVGEWLSVPFNAKSKFAIVNQAIESSWDPDLASEIQDRLETYPDDKDYLFSLAVLYKRKGDLEIARRIYERLANSYQESVFFNNLGNVYFLLGREKDAYDMYNYAIHLATTNEFRDIAEPYYNLNEYHNEQFDLTQSMEARRRAGEIDPSLLDRFREIRKPENHNRYLADMYFQPEHMRDLVSASFVEGVRGQQATGFWTAGIISGFSAESLMGPGVALVIIFLLYVLVFRRQKELGSPDMECSVCQAPITKKSRRMMKSEILCPSCYGILSGVRRPGMQQHLREKLVRTAEKKRLLITRVFSLFPGGGHIFRGYLGMGLFSIGFTYVGILLWYNNGVFVPQMPHLNYGDYPDSIRLAMLGVIWGIFYITVFHNATKIRPQPLKKETVVEEESYLGLDEE
ncbi:MAG: hypothetical protein D6675_05940 [Gemmatimonadetes bacterium]|nr:MAG: hypothetical protein D6675_05940 [Gemmatimonadota bacterium]